MRCARMLACSLLPYLIFSSVFGRAQAPATVEQQASQNVPANANARRIAEHPDLTARVKLTGHLPAWATPATASATVAPETTLHLDLVLSRAPAVEAAFQQRLRDQQDRTSALYHQWLTPAQIGTLYG